MKKFFWIFVILFSLAMIMFSLGFNSLEKAYAMELTDVEYIFEDESCNATFILIDESNYKCNAINKETGETIEFNSTYIKEDNKMTFYLTGEVLLYCEIIENNKLIKVEEPSVEESPSNELPIEDEYTKKVTEWIIAGVCGLLGTSAVAVAFRKQLKELIAKILSALGVLNTNKDETEKQVKAIQDKAEKTLASLEKVKEEMLEENKEQFDDTKQQIEILTKAIMFIACGMTELVANGTSETISDMLKGKENEGKEV